MHNFRDRVGRVAMEALRDAVAQREAMAAEADRLLKEKVPSLLLLISSPNIFTSKLLSDVRRTSDGHPLDARLTSGGPVTVCKTSDGGLPSVRRTADTRWTSGRRPTDV